MAQVYVFLADGFETIEALTTVDVMRRCGIETQTVSISDSLTVKTSHGIAMQADTTLRQAHLEDGEVIVLPGGYPGYVHLTESQGVAEALKSYEEAHKIIAAICAAPSLLAKYHIAPGAKITYHTSVRDRMADYNYQGQGVCRDGNLITATGAGWSLPFAFAIVEAIASPEILAKVKHAMEL